MSRRVPKSRKPDRKRQAARTRRATRPRKRQAGHGELRNGNGDAALVVRAKSDARQLPVLGSAPAIVPCLSCGLCCSYIAVDIEEPRTLKGATDILWYLYHPGISIYAEDDDWMVVFETRCQHQLDDHRCSIYETRPQICRAFDENDCEVNSEEVGETFYTPREFLAYLERHHKRIHTMVRKRYMAPEESLDGRAVPQSAKGPLKPRLIALRVERSRLQPQ
jgi:Fe-S-cluster containining protein